MKAIVNTTVRKVEFELDDGYGGIYPVTAWVRVWREGNELKAQMVESEGPIDRDGGEIESLWKETDEKAIELAIHDFEYWERA